jgi:hypothetical protein
MQGIPKNTTTAVLRRVSFTLVDGTDLFTPEDITVSGVKVSLSVSGGTPANSTNDIVKVNGTNGEYYIELTQTEVNVDAGNVIRGWLKPTGCALTKLVAQVVPVGALLEPITTDDIADEVETRTIAGVSTVNGLASGIITDTSIATDAITNTKIATGAITAAKFAAGAIDAASIASNAITAAKIATDAITDAKIAASAVTKVADGVVGAEIAVLPTFNRTGTNGNTGLQIGTTAFDITTNANAEPIVQIDIPPGP